MLRLLAQPKQARPCADRIKAAVVLGRLPIDDGCRADEPGITVAATQPTP